MNWIGSVIEYHRFRDVLYNKTVFLNKNGLNDMVSGFDTIFNSFVNFTDEISSIKLMPINILGEVFGKLKTTRGKTNVSCFRPYNENYFYLGQTLISPYFNNFADYKGYTQIKVYLPFLGFVDIDPNIFMNNYIQFRIIVDYYTGKGLYIIGKSNKQLPITTGSLPLPYRRKNDDVDMEVIYTYETDIGVEIPLGTSNFGDIVRNIALGTIKTAVGVGMSVYTNSLPPPTITKYTSTESRGRVRETKTTTTSIKESSSNWVSPVTEAVNGSIDVLNRLNVSGHGDRVSGSSSTWDLQGNIKIIYYRPKMISISNDFLHLYGKPLGSVELLNGMVGYTEVSSVHIHGENFDNATKSELENLNNILLGGVIFDDYVYDTTYEMKSNLPKINNLTAGASFTDGFQAFSDINPNVTKIFVRILFLGNTINFVDDQNNSIVVARISENGTMNFETTYTKIKFTSKIFQSKKFMELFGYYFSIA